MVNEQATQTETEENPPRDSYSWREWRNYRHHHRHNRHGSLGALILILIGIIFLLNNFGLLPSNLWNIIWQFWPVLLIIWGLEMIGGRSKTMNLLTGIIGIIVLLIIFIIVLAAINPPFSTWLHTLFPILNSLPASD